VRKRHHAKRGILKMKYSDVQNAHCPRSDLCCR
jgi:hypothetical protein